MLARVVLRLWLWDLRIQLLLLMYGWWPHWRGNKILLFRILIKCSSSVSCSTSSNYYTAGWRRWIKSLLAPLHTFNWLRYECSWWMYAGDWWGRDDRWRRSSINWRWSRWSWNWNWSWSWSWSSLHKLWNRWCWISRRRYSTGPTPRKLLSWWLSKIYCAWIIRIKIWHLLHKCSRIAGMKKIWWWSSIFVTSYLLNYTSYCS